MSMLKTNYVKGQKAKKSFQFNSLTPKLFSLVFSPIWRKKKKLSGLEWKTIGPHQFSPPTFSTKHHFHLSFLLFPFFLPYFPPNQMKPKTFGTLYESSKII